MTPKETLLMMTILKLLDKPTDPKRIKEVYEEQKEMFEKYKETLGSTYDENDIKFIKLRPNGD